MIKLLDILLENNIPDKVYHFTLPKYFVNMVKTNTIKADPKFKQISFTTDPDLWAFREFTDEDQEVAGNLGIRSIPTIIMFKDGKQVDIKVGGLSEMKLTEWIKDVEREREGRRKVL